MFPLETEFRTLMKGEYISLNVSNDTKVQAINVTGVLGGSLRCDEPRPTSRRNGGGERPHRENSSETA